MSEIAADVSMDEYLNQSDLSDEEDAQQLKLDPFHVDWLDMSAFGCPAQLGISDLPGCRFKDNWRSLSYDIDCLKGMGVLEVFCLCTRGELYLCRVKNLFEKYAEAGITSYDYEIEDGQIPEMCQLMKLLEEIRLSLMAGKKTLVHCYGDGGRSCAVAVCLLLVLDENLSVEDAIEKVRDVRKKHAISSIKQYNFVNGFKDALKEYNRNADGSENRSLSR